MPNPAVTLDQAIYGLFKDFKTDTSRAPKFFEFAPPVGQDSITGEYMVLSSSKKARTANLPLPTGWTAQHPITNVAYAVESVSITRRVGEMFPIPDRVKQSLESDNPQLDILRDGLETILPPLYQTMLDDFIAACDTFDLPTGVTDLDLTDTNAPIAATFRQMKREIQKDIGRAPTVRPKWIIDPDTYDLLLEQDELYSGGGITNVASGDTVRRETLDEEYVVQWFRSKLGVDLIVEDMVNTDGFGLGAKSYFGYVTPGRQDGPVKTLYQTVGRAGRSMHDVLGVYTGRTQLPFAPGDALACDAAYQFKVISKEFARRLPITRS